MSSLLKTRWVRVAASSDAAAQRQLAKRLGLTEEILARAVCELRQSRAQQGRPVPGGRRRRGVVSQMPQLLMRAPPEALEAWRSVAARLHMQPNSLMRGAVHDYLLDGVAPLRLDPRWVVDGRVYAPVSKRGQRGGTLCTLISVGARDALQVRAEQLGVSVHTLCIGLMNDVLAGRRRVRRPVHRMNMYEDPRRYLQ